MFKYAIIDNSKRSINGTLTAECIVGVKLANSKRAALAGFSPGHQAIPESSFQGKGNRKFREKIEELRDKPIDSVEADI